MSNGDVGSQGTPLNPPADRLLLAWTLYATIAQLAMVGAGHWIEAIRNAFAIGGMVICAVTAALFARAAGLPRSRSALYGAIIGAAGALIGIAVSVALGDTKPMILLVGTVSSACVGAVGGAVGTRTR